MPPRHTLLADLLPAVEQLLLDADLGMKRLDRLTLDQTTANNLQHKAFVILPTSTSDLNQYGRGDLARAQDNLTVRFSYRIVGGVQREKLREALVLEEQIRVIITAASFDRWSRLTWTGTPTRQLTSDGEWYTITQTFTTRRDALLGGR